jgi:hypothetical protein
MYTYNLLLTLLPVLGLIETVTVLTAPIFCAAGLTLSMYGSMFCSAIYISANADKCETNVISNSLQQCYNAASSVVLSC